VLSLTIILCVLPAAHAGGQTLQLVPSTHVDRAPQSFVDACMHIGQWPRLYTRTTYLGAVSWQLRPDRASDSTLAACFTQLRAHGLQLSLEVGITGVFSTGADAYRVGWQEWQRYLALRAPLTTLFIDEPITNGMRLSGLSYAEVVRETVNWIVLVRQNRSLTGIKLVLIEAYPHMSAPTIIDFINDVNNLSALRGVGGLDGLQIDHAWDSGLPWSGSDLGAMRAAARQRRMEFSLIFYAAMPFQNPTDDCAFGTRLFRQWDAYKANGIDTEGFYPDIYTVQSWDQLPSATVPESTDACTFMRGARLWQDALDLVPPVHENRWRFCQGMLPCEAGQ
jgi:hypothetical protein